MIQTVTGPIHAEALGVTLAHEHVFIDLRCLHDPAAAADHPYQSEDNLCLIDETTAAAELSLFKKAGGQSLIDLTVDGLDPNPLALRRLSEQSGVQVVAGVGLYRVLAHPPWVRSAGVEELTDRFVRGLHWGIGPTPVRAGLLGEIGTSSPIDPEEVKVLRAAARAHLATAVPINVHPAIFAREGPRILDILQAEGVDLRRVALSHMDERLDYDYHCSLLVRGAWLSFDTFGSEFRLGSDREPTDGERIQALIRLLNAGWAGQILLSQDVCTKLHLTTYGGRGYAHLLTRIVPALQSRGVTPDTVHELLVLNPRRYLTGQD